MSFLPVSYFILIGAFGLIFSFSVAFFLLSCGKLHRLEGAQAWRITWYCILIETVLACLSFAITGFIIYSITSTPYSPTNDWWDTASQVIAYGTELAGFAGLTALIVALAHPLRKKSSTTGTHSEGPQA